MRKSSGLFAAFLLAAMAASAAPPKMKSHANTLKGTVTAVDTARKRLVVKDERGKETAVVWTGATHVSGGTLKAGERVTVRWMRRDGKNIATAVKVFEETEKSASAAPSASLSPTPKSR